VLVEALSTGHKVGLGVTAAAFIAFALLSAFVFPRIRASYPGRGLPAFIVVCLVFFFGMLTAVENFGGESSEAATETTSTSPTNEAQPTVTSATPTAPSTTPAATTTAATTTVALPPATTTTAKPKPPAAQTIPAVETEFKITLSKQPKAGPVTFDVKNVGKLPHDFVIQGGGLNEKTPTLNPGATAKLKVTLKPGSYDVYCSIPGHKQAGMDVKLNVGA
jgi:uncharacterized cupredoxin-like copper-binding protein